MFRVVSAIVIGLSLLTTGPALAQTADGQDWQLIRAPERKTVLALAEFDNGIALASRCVDGDFEVTLNGLPEIRSPSRTLRVSVGDEPLAEETWTTADVSTAAFSRVPAPFARRLAKGGKLQVVVPGERGTPNRRYVMELSPSPAALEQTLIACGRGLVDARDLDMDRNASDGLTGGLAWVRLPRPEYPDSVNNRIALRGSVTLSCLTNAEGRAEDCVIESEHPGGFNFGKAVLRSMERARLTQTGDGPSALPGRMFLFTTNFVMQDY